MTVKTADQTLSATARICVHCPSQKVFDAFSDASAMSQFWFTRKDNGLEAGKSVAFFMGPEDGAFSFDVMVKDVSAPDRIVIEWVGADALATRVTFSFVETEEGDTILEIEESGFGGNQDQAIRQALDSTGGFNQVIVAAKAFVEHGVAINVVSDHA